MMFLFCIIYIQSKDDIKMWVHTCQWMLQYRIFQAGKMLWTLLSKASTMIFCCIMSKARLTETKWAGGHISVGPKTKKREKQNNFNQSNTDPVLLAVFEFWFFFSVPKHITSELCNFTKYFLQKIINSRMSDSISW